MKTPSEIIPKFIISLEKDKERSKYVKNEVIPKLTNYFKCRAFDGEIDDPNTILEDNGLIIAEHFANKCTKGQLGCFLSHFQIWKYMSDKNIEIAIILEDDVKLYKNFNRVIDTIYENLPIKFDYVHLFIHPDKLNVNNLDGNDGDIIPAEENYGTVAYMLSLRGAKRLVKLTQLLKIQAPVDRQINYYIDRHFLKGYMVKKPFLITQGEIMPNRSIYENGFKSHVWYSKKIVAEKTVNPKYIKPAGFDETEISNLDKELETQKKETSGEDNNVDGTKLESSVPSKENVETNKKVTEVKKEEVILVKVAEKSKKEEVVKVANTDQEAEPEFFIDLIPKVESDSVKAQLDEARNLESGNNLEKEETDDDDDLNIIDLVPKNNTSSKENSEEDEIVSAIIGRLKENPFNETI